MDTEIKTGQWARTGMQKYIERGSRRAPSVQVSGTRYVASRPLQPVVVLPGRTTKVTVRLGEAADPSALVVS